MLNIVLPRNVRDGVRELIRNHPAFESFCIDKGIDSRDLNKANTMAAIESLGLESQVRAMIAAAPVETGPVGDIIAQAADEMSVMSATAMESRLKDSVLGPLRPFLSPVLLDTVTTALQPIIDAALRPAPVAAAPVTIVVDSNGVPIVPAFVPAQRVGVSTIGKLFGINGRPKHSDKQMSQWNAADAPKLDPYFVPDLMNLAKLVSAIDPALPRTPRNVWLAGPAGTGKSSLPAQVAARARRSFCHIAFQKAVEPADLIGGNGLVNGSTVWVDGVLIAAIRRPGTVILLDEITFAPPGLAGLLQTLLAERYATLPTGERVECADGVCFVLADNTKGYGDESGIYAGTHMANAALVDRSARLVVVDYLAADLESAALANHTGAPLPACQRVVTFANTARKLAGYDGRPFSLRRQIAFVDMVYVDGFTVAESFEDTVLTRLPDAENAAIRAHFKAAFDDKAFTAELFGKGGSIPATGAQPIHPGTSVPSGTFTTID
jgi:MoxR-like ATPase